MTILAGNTQHLLLQLRCLRKHSIPEPGALQGVTVPLGAAWVNAIIQSTAVSVLEVAAVLSDQTSHLPELEVIEPGQFTHCQTPA